MLAMPDSRISLVSIHSGCQLTLKTTARHVVTNPRTVDPTKAVHQITSLSLGSLSGSTGSLSQFG